MKKKTILMSDIKFKLIKTWQGKNYSLVMQIQTPKSLQENLPKKMYLIVDLTNKNKAIYISHEKAKDLLAQGTLANIIRKYMPTIWIKDIICDSQNGDIWIVLQYGNSSEPDWYLKYEKLNPPILYLIAKDKTTFFRFSKLGTYSKKSIYQGEIPSLENNSIISQLISEITPELNIDEIDTEETINAITTEISTANHSVFQMESKKRLKRRLKTALKSVNRQQKQTPSLSDIQSAEEKGKLLQQFLYRVKEGSLELILSAEEINKNSSLKIDLNPDISPGQNVDEYFLLAKKLKKGKIFGEKQQEIDTKYIDYLKLDIENLELNSLSENEITQILKKYKLSASKQNHKINQKAQNTKPYRVFSGVDGAEFLVGKSAAENDEMVKNSKSNDYWFHIIETTGSHVILTSKSIHHKSPNQKQIRQGAILAIHFSKIRNNGRGDVYFTQKQHLKKKKGMPAGLWNVEKSESVFISYEEEELKTILATADLQ